MAYRTVLSVGEIIVVIKRYYGIPRGTVGRVLSGQNGKWTVQFFCPSSFGRPDQVRKVPAEDFGRYLAKPRNQQDRQRFYAAIPT